MKTSFRKASIVLAATVGVSASVLIGSAQPALAYQSCIKTFPADPYQQTWVSVSCPSPQPGVPDTDLFRAVVYLCTTPGCAGSATSTKAYGEWEPLNGTSTAHANGEYIDPNRVSVEYESGVTFQ